MSERSKREDIGHGVSIVRVSYEGEPAGVEYYHPRPDGSECSGWAHFVGGSWDFPGGWTVEKREPLTLSPSLLCRGCGHHGFIREGRWVPA